MPKLWNNQPPTTAPADARKNIHDEAFARPVDDLAGDEAENDPADD
jgi:hypothetical protein